MFLKFRENFKRPKFPKLRLLRYPHFLRVFLPFVLLDSACGLASGRGSRGYTPLHLAAHAGHDSVVQRLLEAKAAMDVKNDVGRGLGLGLGGNDIMRRGIVVSKWLKYWWFKCFVEIVFTFDGTFGVGSMFWVPRRNFSIVDFRLAVFWSDHRNPKVIPTLQHCSMDPDILTFTSPIVWNDCFWSAYYHKS